MSELQEQKTEVVILERIPSHQHLVKVNRWLMATVVLLMGVIIVAGFFIVPSNNARFKIKDLSGVDSNPVLSAEVNTLKGQFVGLVSGSIESKLRALEESIRLGTVSNSLGTLEDLKNDVQVLKSYSDPVNKEVPVAVPNDQLIQEMSHLKRLVYLTLTSCGLMVAAMAGVWLKNRLRIPNKEVLVKYLIKH